AQLCTAVALYDAALSARAMEGFSAACDFATTPFNRCLATEAAATEALTLANIGEAVRRVDDFFSRASALQAPVHRLRATVARAEIAAEEAAPPEQILSLIAQAEAIHQRHRVDVGVHAMLMTRNKGEALMRLGRLAEAEETLHAAARFGADLSYMPIRIFTSLTRLHSYGARVQDTRALGEQSVRSEDAQREMTHAFGQLLLILCDVAAGAPPAGWVAAARERMDELRRFGLWPVAYRYLAMHALSVAAVHARVEEAEQILRIAERALEASPSPTASALFRRHRGVLLLRAGRLIEARQSLEAALATFDFSGNVPESALVRRTLANLDAIEGDTGAGERLERAAGELTRLGMAVLPELQAEAAPVQRAVSAQVDMERLIVPLQRLSTRGVGAPIIQKELLNVAGELFPGRAVRLEEVDSTGGSTDLGSRPEFGAAAPEWFEFSDGVGRRMRLGVEGTLDRSQRASVHILLAHAALAFEVASLRGFRSAPQRPSRQDVASAEASPLPDFIAASPSLRRLKAELARLSGSRGTIIVTGESGTGKEVIARAIHELSRRASRPYVTFNSAAVPRELFEGQLFGYRKGAFTGATADHPGVIRAAHGGTLFLDEIGELPIDVQPKLLRFLENGEVLPLGERTPVQVDVRVIAATHRDLLQRVREGKFREDLYYRLQVIPLHIP
ncbi:MAG TPA: sigma-54 factor interaction domain-containing protein, partial [Myxococcaceae bacterium]|nr:sigma-54 factor interaction domain-containing protein [Myxococcaceae bacterium]